MHNSKQTNIANQAPPSIDRDRTSMAAKVFPRVLMLLILSAALPIQAQFLSSAPGTSTGISPHTSVVNDVRRIELSTGAQELSNGYGEWQDLTLLASYEKEGNVWQAELAAKRQYGQNGKFLGLSSTLNLDADWFTMLSIGAGDGAFYLPQFRADATLYRKWLEQRNLVTSLGAGYYRAPDGHIDRSISVGAAYYFTQPWIVELGARVNYSDPGSIRSSQQFVAATYGRMGSDVVTARYGWGNEGYQAIASNVTLVNFDSRILNLSWRHWFNARSGVLLSVEQYTNPSYQRQGITAGLFHQF